MIFWRVLLWFMISFVFLRGVITSIRPDTAGEALRAISDFRVELTAFKELDSEMLAFAEGFAVDWLGEKAELLYVRAYRKEAYSVNQYDVFVSAIVLFTNSDEHEQQRVTLRIPVAVREIGGINRYIVEDTPVFMNDDTKLHDHAVTPFVGEELDRNRQSDVLLFLTDFFEAYYHERQSIIDNFLSPDADKAVFQGLNGLLTFERVEDSSRVYRGENGVMLALVTLTAHDPNGSTFAQNLTVHVIERDGRFFVQRLDTRILNLNF
jgi:hypothetical protein